MIGDPYADGLLLRVQQPARHLPGGREDERVAAGGGRLDRAEQRVVDLDELAQLREVPAHQREVVAAVEVADRPDPVEAVLVAQPASERVPRVGRVRDHSVAADDLDYLPD